MAHPGPDRVGAYLLAMLVRSGLLWDVEHFAAFVLGVAAGPFLAGRLPARPRLRFDRRTQRTSVAMVIAVLAVSALVEGIYPGNGGPFHGDDSAARASGSTLAIVVAAILLLVTADGLRRGRRLAWILTAALVGATFVAALSSGHGSQRNANIALAAAELVLLAVAARSFTSVADRRSFRNAGVRLAVVALCLALYTAVGFGVLQDDFRPKATPPKMLGEFASRLFFTTTGAIDPVTTPARVFVNSIGAIWATVIVLTIVGLLYSSRRPVVEPEADDRLRALLRAHHSSNIEWMLTWKDITVWFSADGQTAIGYEKIGSVALSLADPVGPLHLREAALREWDAHCFRRGWIPCLFAAGQQTADLAATLGWKSVEVAEDSVMPLADLEFKGKVYQDVRTAINKAGKQDVTLEVTRWQDATPVVTDQLQAISGGWVSDKALPEMGFTLGTLREADDPEVRLCLAVDADRTIEGFTSWMPVGRDGQVVGWTLDLMRRRDHGFRPVMEFLIAASALHFKEEGYEFVSLSAAPLAKAPDDLAGNSDQQVLQKLLDFLGNTLEPYYGFKSLFAFKQKFNPEHHPMYLVFPDSTALAEIGIAVARAYMPTAGLRDWMRMGIEMIRPPRQGDDHAG